MLEVGKTMTFSAKLYDKDPSVDNTAVLVNPAAIGLTITAPDGSIATPSVANPPTPTGTFSQKVVATQVGRYFGRWLFTMADGTTTVYTEIFDIQPTDPGFIISLTEAKNHLNIPLSRTNSDEEIRSWMAAITPVIEDLVGPTIPKTYTEVVSGVEKLTLSNTPVISITSIIPFYYGTTYVGETLVKSTPDGEVRLIYGGAFYGRTFTVTYVAGRKPIGPNITQAAKIILKHLWETQRGASSTPFQGDDEAATDLGYGFAIPNRALELLKPSRLGPSVG
jgi:hypothetical protein